MRFLAVLEVLDELFGDLLVGGDLDVANNVLDFETEVPQPLGAPGRQFVVLLLNVGRK